MENCYNVKIFLWRKIMISFISFLMYLSFFILCLGIEIKREKNGITFFIQSQG